MNERVARGVRALHGLFVLGGFLLTLIFGFGHSVGGLLGWWGVDHYTFWLGMCGLWMLYLGVITSEVAD